MKFISLISLFCLSNSISAQNIALSVDIPEKTSFEKAIIHFNDGTSIEGIGRLKTIFTSKEEVIIFKIEEKDKDETWTVKDAKGITIISEDDGIKEYQYLKVTKNSFAELYEVVTEGNVKLYKKAKTNSKNPAKMVLPMIVGNAPRVAINNEHYQNKNDTFYAENATYYMQRETETYPTKVRDNYIKSFADYMKDCDVMVEKIKNHEYNYSTLKELVDYYNANCGE